jgi:hypothetical protein
MTPLAVGLVILAVTAAFGVGGWSSYLVQQRGHRLEQRATESRLAELLATRPNTLADFRAILEPFRPAWIPMSGFIEATIYKAETPAWRAVAAALKGAPGEVSATELLARMHEAEAARERAATKGAACTSCPLHCRRAKP